MKYYFYVIFILILFLIFNYFLNKNEYFKNIIENFTSNLENKCIPYHSNYEKVCRPNGIDYGIKTIENCDEDENNVKINCGKMIFNGIDYSDEGLYTTGCIDQSLDMDTMCNTYMPNDIKSTSKLNGYYNRSGGSKIILNGKHGDCYNNDGSPNKNKSRAICDLRSNRKINRIPPFNEHIKYNKFTGCHNMESYDFKKDCQKILKDDNINSVYAEIDGFDCMPGFARAKCLDKDEFITNHSDFYKFVSES